MGRDVTDERVPEPDLAGAGAGLRVAVVCGRFNSHVTLRLLDGVRRGLADCGVTDIQEVWVPGAFEIPVAAKTFAGTGRYDAVIGIGCVIRGDTAHFEYVAGQCAEGLQRVGLDTGVPAVFGVLTTETLEQALERSEDAGGHNVGEEGARTAVEMANLLASIRARIDDTGAHMLKVVLPKGSLEKATLELFDAADLSVKRSSEVDYKATIADPRVEDVRILRPQEIPTYVADGLFDLGITGRDWVEETASEVVTLGELQYSKATARPFRIVVAVPEDSPWDKVEDLPRGVRVSSEYPALTRRFFAERGVEADVRLSYGATEAKVPDIVDCVVDGTETGRALRAAKLKIIGEIMQSYTALIANADAYADPAKRHAMEQLKVLLDGVLEARGKVLVKLNVGDADLDAVIALVPSMKSPTVSKLFGEGGYAVETVVEKAVINTLIPALKDAGATDIIELPLAKIVH